MFCRLEELKTTQQNYLESLKKHEEKYMGGFRRIYPADGEDKYSRFFENSCSLFQTTAAAKAREEAAKFVDNFINFFNKDFLDDYLQHLSINIIGFLLFVFRHVCCKVSKASQMCFDVRLL